MTLKTLSKYIRYSGIWVGAALNPFHWDFRYETYHPDDMNPNLRGIYVCAGPVWVRLILDDGSW